MSRIDFLPRLDVDFRWVLICLSCFVRSFAYQPHLFFAGRLTTSFTNFTRVLLEGNDPIAIAEAKDTVLHDSALNASYLVYIGLGMLVCTYGYMVIWQVTAELASRRIRERFLKATLTQEISFFDDLGSGEVATRIESDTHLVHTGLGEKVPTSVQYISTFLTGFILAFGEAGLGSAMLLVAVTDRS